MSKKKKTRPKPFEPPDELGRLVEEVIQGRAVYMIPPGGSAFLVTIAGQMTGAGLWAAFVGGGLFQNSTVTYGGMPLALACGMGLCAFQLFAFSGLSLLVIRGYGRAHGWFKVYSATLTVLAGLGLMASLLGLWDVPPLPNTLPVVLFGIATLSLYNWRYMLYSAFMERLHQRRREVTAMQRAAARKMGLNPK